LTKKPGASFAGKIDCSMTSRGGTMTLTPTIRRQLRLPRQQIGGRRRCRSARLVRAVTSGGGGGFRHEVRHRDD
jgi:hypothetical protein